MSRSKGTTFDFLPATVEELERTAAALARRAPAKTMPKSYSADWARWLAFCAQSRINPLPANAEDVHCYLMYLGVLGGPNGTKFRPKSAERKLAAILAGHRVAGLTFDIQDPILKKIIDGIYGARVESARAFRAGDIAEMCATFGLDLRSLRDKAIILLGFAGGFRRSEIVALNVSDLVFDDGLLRVTHHRLKANQKRRPRTTVIKPNKNSKTCAVAAVRTWLRAAEIEHEGAGPVFHPVEGHGRIKFRRLCDSVVDRIVKSAARAAGLKEHYSADSLRAGHLMEALNAGYEVYSLGL